MCIISLQHFFFSASGKKKLLERHSTSTGLTAASCLLLGGNCNAKVAEVLQSLRIVQGLNSYTVCNGAKPRVLSQNSKHAHAS